MGLGVECGGEDEDEKAGGWITSSNLQSEDNPRKTNKIPVNRN